MNEPEIAITASVILFIEALSEAYPHRCIRLGESEIDAHRYAAVRDFIDELIAIKDEHLEGNDENTGDA